MRVYLSSVALSATLLALLQSTAFAFTSDEIPLDTPISSLLASAKANLAKGNAADALTYYDLAIARDPSNYLSIFQRGAAYLSLGKNSKASEDFDRALKIKPDFEGALLQRARIKSKNGEWDAARYDYETASKKGSQEFSDLVEAQGAATLAFDAEKNGDWEGCVSQSGVAIMIASTALNLRQLRAKCRFEKGEIQEGVNDLKHALQINPESTEPHLKISSMLFYSLGDTEQGLAQIRKCLHSDPDSKACSRLYKREKKIDKKWSNAKILMEKRQFNNAVKVLVGEEGLIAEVNRDVKDGIEAGTIHRNAPNELYYDLEEMACEAYYETNNLKRASPFCKKVLAHRPTSLHALLAQAKDQLSASSYEDAIRTLNTAKEAHPEAAQSTIDPLLQKAHVDLKRASQKDYYAVLGVHSDADDRTIKKAYRQLTKKHHPDRAMANGEISKEEAEKKMAAINEAYEVLSDPELRARFDRGDDPNSQEAQHQHPFQQGAPFGGQQFVFRSSGGGQGGQHFKFSGGFPGGGFQFPGGFGGGGGFPF
ncbi:MAG: hypothetical protein M1834_008706 [Cirrosporium novae-zelandiae]|nr:MAG: hypothetical protein M1834_008706 [Cirrosporium novae-zelandiae]